ncbi:hypothetical protein CAI16_20055 [Virgibacillus dokdonensis]|uniref:Uncharacterized protein n=1 Tax=Virgibacillus dokdonensis TaxID=302167 RepID=A0A3E0WH22_9BACI|nr:hypothetical protein CAI16_20055 [Virgibacillus dokdonensis]
MPQMILKPLSRNIKERLRYLTYYLSSLHIHEFQTKLLGTEGGDSSGESMSLETPRRTVFVSVEGSSHARGKRTPVAKSNGCISRTIFMNDSRLRRRKLCLNILYKEHSCNEEI